MKWSDSDELSDAIATELAALGHEPHPFRFDQPIPPGVDVVFTFAPYGRLQQLLPQIQGRSPRPLLVHWNTENYPNPDLPWSFVRLVGRARSSLDRLNNRHSRSVKRLLAPINNRLIRYRLIGDYHYAYQKGYLALLFESSRIYAEMHSRHGVPARFVPWGTVSGFYSCLQLPRDIDVLWMGKRRTKRRSEILNQVARVLARHNFTMHIADNEIQPFVYGAERTKLLNRSKITLHLESNPFDNAFPYRYHIAAANGSLVVSEVLVPHYPLTPGEHYVSASPAELPRLVLHYLEKHQERQDIIANAHELVTTRLTFANSVKMIMAGIADVHC